MADLGGRRAQLAVETLHPTVLILYFVAVVTLCMCALEPVFVGISLTGALATGCLTRGVRAVMRDMRWQLPVLVVVSLANPLFSGLGATLLAHVGPWDLRLESLAFGVCMGVLLMAALGWLSSAGAVLAPDDLLSVAAKRLPAIALMTTVAARVARQTLARGAAMRRAQQACTAAPSGRAHVPVAAAQTATALMGWALEDSLDQAASLRARGWVAGAQRTSFCRRAFGPTDAAAGAVIAVLTAVSAVGAWRACGAWGFYPVLAQLMWRRSYVAYAALVSVPLIAELAMWARWHRGARLADHANGETRNAGATRFIRVGEVGDGSRA